MSAPTPPAEVKAAVAELRAAFGDLHEMHECSTDCPESCDQSDYSESAYRHHDEHNADVREDIELKAGALVEALDAWLGSANLTATAGEASR